jgi:hypothetical protein
VHGAIGGRLTADSRPTSLYRTLHNAIALSSAVDLIE